MRKIIYIGADSAGYELKEKFKATLVKEGYDVHDCGTNSTASCHYPIFASEVSKNVVASNDTAYGILICGTGIGMSMCANKYNGIRAAVCSDTFSARMTRIHNDANVLCLGARVVGIGLADELAEVFVKTEFEGGKHARRVGLISDIEARG